MKIYMAAMRVVFTLVICGSLASARPPQPAPSLPVGTAIPVTFPHTIDAAKLKVGDPVVVKTDQMILGAGGERIRGGLELVGKVVEVQSSGSSVHPSELAIMFDTLRVRDQAFALRVSLRAMASFVVSYGVRSPADTNDNPESSLYRQVGGDYFYRGKVVYSDEWQEVGKSTGDGVFVKLEQVAERKSANQVVCESTDSIQSVGIFASNACGLYGFVNLSLGNSGADDSGIIRFRSTKNAVKIASGSTALLQVIAPAE